MAIDELTRPLGQPSVSNRRFVIDKVLLLPAAGLLAGFLLGGGLLLLLDRSAGETVVAVSTVPAAPPAPNPERLNPNVEALRTSSPANPPISKSRPPARTNVVTIIDGMTGKRQEVIIGPSSAGGELVGEDFEGETSATPSGGPHRAIAARIDPRLIEMTRYGPIPRIGPDGLRAASVYAEPVTLSPASNGPRIAIIVEGLGSAAANHPELLAKLPSAVTLAFAPDGPDLQSRVDEARSNHHEILLEVPMELAGSGDHDRDPQLPLSSQGADRNVERLHWFMSRFQGYVGITVEDGGRFAANTAAAASVLADIARRGLIYFDDARSPKSVAGKLCALTAGGCVTADVVLDALPSANDIDNALSRLERLAKDRGSAVGVTAATPVGIERLSRWVTAATSRGVVLIPLSIALGKSKPS